MRKIEISKELLEDMLKRMTPAEVAKSLGVSRNTVARRMAEYGVEPKFHYRPPSAENILSREYLESVKDTHTYRDVMAETGLKKSTVNNYLRKYGIRLKTERYRGEKSKMWKGGSFVRKSGNSKYRYVATHRDSEGKLQYKREHILVMEQHIGRPLKDNEVVHHVDGNGLNNSVDNLVLMTKAQHNRFHILLSCFKIDHKTLTKAQVEWLIQETTMATIRNLILNMKTYAEHAMN